MQRVNETVPGDEARGLTGGFVSNLGGNLHATGYVPLEEFRDLTSGFVCNEEDYLTTFDQSPEILDQLYTSQVNPLAGPVHSPTIFKGSGVSGREAALERESPGNFTTYADDRSNPTNATSSVQNSPVLPPASFNHSTSTYGPRFLTSSYQATASSRYLVPGSPVVDRDWDLQGLGIHGAQDGYPYESVASSMNSTQIHTPDFMSDQVSAGQEPFKMEDVQDDHVTKTRSAHDATRPIGTYDFGSGFVPSTPDLTAVELNNYSPDINMPSTHNTDAGSTNYDDSPQITPAFARTNGASRSYYSPHSVFQTTAQPLTAWQMVDEATHRPTMDLMEVPLQHENSRKQELVVYSMDYRDLSWQGRRDECKGWTPYVKFADFPDVKEMLQNMRSNPSEYMPDNATIFENMQQVEEWRENERKKLCRNQDPQDPDELPRTDEEKAAIVKLLFKAFKSTVEGQSNKDVMTHFNAQVHSNAHVEAICWQLLELAIKRSEGGPLGDAYEPGKPAKSAGNRDLSFADRVNKLIQALMWEKSVCVNLLRAPKDVDAIDYPGYLGKRTGSNRVLNHKKAEIARLGKMKLEEIKTEITEHLPGRMNQASRYRAPTRRGKRSKEQADDSESEAIKAAPRKRRSPERNPLATPSRQLTSVNPIYSDSMTYSPKNSYPTNATPSATVMGSNTSSPHYYSFSPGPTPSSSTSAIRGQMSRYSLNGRVRPSYRTVPRSPLQQTSSLVSGGNLPGSYATGYANGLAIQDQDPYQASDAAAGGSHY